MFVMQMHMDANNSEQIDLISPENDESASGDTCEALLAALESKDFEAFKAALNPKYVDFYYKTPRGKRTILDLTCSRPDSVAFVEELLSKGANPNNYNHAYQSYPIFSAIKRGFVDVVKIIVESGKFDVNSMTLKQTTAVNFTVNVIKNTIGDKSTKEEKLEEILVNLKEILKILLQASADVNIPEISGWTPIFRAAEGKMKDVVEIILQYSKNIVDIDCVTNKNKNARMAINKNFKEILANESYKRNIVKLPSAINIYRLLQNLHKKEERIFLNKWKTMKSKHSSLLEFKEGSFTLLQMACARNLFKSVEILLNDGADPELMAENSTKSPLHFICWKGYHQVLESFVTKCRNRSIFDDSTLLLEIINGKKAAAETAMNNEANDKLTEQADGDSLKDTGVNYEKCVEILLKQKEVVKNINVRDKELGNTALHYATMYDLQDIVLELLRAEAYVGFTNEDDQLCLLFMSPDILKKYLDECVTTNGKHPNEPAYRINFNYRFLLTPQASKDKEDYGMNIFKHMTDLPSLTKLLKHPLVASLLHIKWMMIRKMLMVNFLIYALFFTSLATYVFLDISHNSSSKIFYGLTVFFLIFLGLREISQMFIFKVRYWYDYENYLELAIITFTVLLLIFDRHEIYVVAVFLASIELVLAISKFSAHSIHFEMFKTVLTSYLRFAVWYIILIFAYSLSFSILFRHDKVGTENNDFKSPDTSFFKTIVMLTGEFELSTINFASFPITSHIFFLFFIFMIPIVLLNLLTGLAISDIQTIKDNSEITKLASLVQVLLFAESVLVTTRNEYEYLLRLFHCYEFVDDTLQNFMLTKFCFGENSLKAYINVNKSYKIFYCNQNDIDSTLTMDPYVIKLAKNTIQEKQNNIPNDELKKKIDGIEKTLTNNNKYMSIIKDLRGEVSNFKTSIQDLNKKLDDFHSQYSKAEADKKTNSNSDQPTT